MKKNADRHTTDDRWHRTGPYEFSHPDGWTITNRIIRRRPVWTLQLGYRSEGAFPSPAEAMKRHAQLGADTSQTAQDRD
ncbi:hypothetical protein BCh11DRAFT_07869 [Burkholderia sp. Ch1-1]|nr:hypothetical protein BCh11DRAFT_07869 [Burkholderia sp. Ch1-1]